MTDEYFSGSVAVGFGTLSRQVEAAYQQMFEQTKDYPFIINCRNFIPNILGEENGLQRYKIFNSVRRKMFMQNHIASYPTACAVGSTGCNFELKYIAAKTPAILIENPEQVSAFKYPIQLGSPPLFSRAATHNGHLLISGTASIKGSETIHPYDIISQLDVTLDNIRILIELSGSKTDDLIYITYVKRLRDFAIVSEILKQNDIESQMVHADICRDDLLVEIEVYSKDLYEAHQS